MICWAAFLVSAFGSLPPGVINLWTSKIAIENGWRKALIFAGISAILEIPHILLAIFFHTLLFNNDLVKNIFNSIAIFFLFGLAVSLLYPKKVIPESEKISESESYKNWLLINLLNPFAIPFWLVMIDYVGFDVIKSKAFYNYLWIGCAALGCFIVLTLYAQLGHYFKKYLVQINRVLAIVYLMMAAIKIFQNLYS